MIHIVKRFRNANLRQKPAKMRRRHFLPERRSKVFRHRQLHSLISPSIFQGTGGRIIVAPWPPDYARICLGPANVLVFFE
jgi:hypothetical protein